MASLEGRCIWVSKLAPPLSSQDIARFFSRNSKVDKVFIPDVEDENALVVLTSVEGVAAALKFDGSSFRDAVIGVAIPTVEQMLAAGDWKEEPQASPDSKSTTTFDLDKMSDDDITTMMDALTSLARSRLQKLDDGTTAMKNLDESPGIAIQYEVASPAAADHFASTSHAPTMIPTLQCPRIVFFSGDDVKAEHASYQQWRNEVRCLLGEGHPHIHVLQAIRRSLKGTASTVLLNIGEHATPQHILQKFDDVFGSALSSEALIEDFYTARQREVETVVAWGCRVESMLSHAKEKGTFSGNTDEMLRTKFWSGILDPNLKNGIRHRFDAGEPYQRLLVAARAVEHEAKGKVVAGSTSTHTPTASKTSGKVQMQATTEESKMDRLLKQMEDLSSRMKKLESRRETEPTSQKSTKPSNSDTTTEDACFYCREKGHFIRDCKKLQKKNERAQKTNPGNAQ